MKAEELKQHELKLSTTLKDQEEAQLLMRDNLMSGISALFDREFSNLYSKLKSDVEILQAENEKVS
jgi:hypothetical protein